VKVTYLLHLWVVLVLTMVQSRPHHLRHQWSQISTFVSLNHLRHHTYSKSSYVHIQVFHILHHHIMKLLLRIKSFLPRRPIVEIGSENWFAAESPFDSENWFVASCPIRQKTGSLQTTQFRQRVTNSLQTTQLWQRMLIRRKRHSFDSESQFCCKTHNSAANANSLQELSFGSESQIRCRQLKFGSEC